MTQSLVPRLFRICYKVGLRYNQQLTWRRLFSLLHKCCTFSVIIYSINLFQIKNIQNCHSIQLSLWKIFIVYITESSGRLEICNDTVKKDNLVCNCLVVRLHSVYKDNWFWKWKSPFGYCVSYAMALEPLVLVTRTQMIHHLDR